MNLEILLRYNALFILSFSFLDDHSLCDKRIWQLIKYEKIIERMHTFESRGIVDGGEEGDDR